MKSILLFGAGKSASALITYLKNIAATHNWNVIVADRDADAVKQKVGEHPLVKAVGVNINDAAQTRSLVQQADVVISLLPPHLHFIVAESCVLFHKHFLTASYIDDEVKTLQKDIEHRNLLFLYEMGLDPGIDHMSAMQILNNIKQQGGSVTSFKSHCGGLVAPESDDNPWHYKISWNSRNIVLAGKAGAAFKEDGKEMQLNYHEIFTNNSIIEIPTLGKLAYYPNRDSLSYIKLYGLENIHTFVRTTLRHPEFCTGWKNLVDLELTSEEIKYDTTNLTLKNFFKQHFENNQFTNWLNAILKSHLTKAKKVLLGLTQTFREPDNKTDDALIVNEEGVLRTITEQKLQNDAAMVANQVHEANIIMQQLFHLGLQDDTPINKGTCSAADILQFILEKKLALQPHDKDMIVMLHEIEYALGGKTHNLQSSLIVKGEDSTHTAMAKTVGLPLGIAAKLILEGSITATGLHIPITPEIYNPVLAELKQHGIIFNEIVS